MDCTHLFHDGLSIGVHLLNLLTIPAIVMIYYFRKYKVTPWGTFIAFVIGCLITGFVQKFVIQYTVDGAGIFDRWFVNGLGLPFYSGFFFFFILLSVLAFSDSGWPNKNPGDSLNSVSGASFSCSSDTAPILPP